jgi:hypothetical protein
MTATRQHAGKGCFSLNRVAATCVTAIAAAAPTVPLTWAALKRTPRPPAKLRGDPRRDSPKQAFTKADTPAQVEVICATVSFAFAIATGVLIAMHVGKATTSELTCAYIAGGIFEIVGIFVTVDALIDTGQGLAFTPEGWAKWRGPALLICGILLGLLATIAWLHMPQAS